MTESDEPAAAPDGAWRALGAAADHMQDGLLVLDADERVMAANAVVRRALPDVTAPGTALAELLAALAARNVAPDSDALARQAWVAACLEEHRAGGLAREQSLTDGRWIMLRSEHFPDGTSLVASTDISDRKGAERRLDHAQRAITAHSRLSEALVRASDETALLQTACRIMVETGGYRFAWVGFAEPDGRVRPVAFAGYERGYLDVVTVTWTADDPRGQGPTGRALRADAPVVVQDLTRAADYRPWADPASARGYEAAAAFPLRVEGATVGSVNVYAAESDAFGERERDLLASLVGDLGYGLGVLRNEQARQAQEELLDFLTAIQSQFIADHDPDETIRSLLAGLLRLTDSRLALLAAASWPDDDGRPHLSGRLATPGGPAAPVDAGPLAADSLLGAALLGRDVVARTDPAADPRAAGLPADLAADADVAAFIAVPLPAGQRIIGVLALGGDADGGGHDTGFLERLRPLVATCGSLLVATEDIQRRRDAEHALRQSEAHYRGLVEHLPDAIFVHRGFTILHANEAAARMAGVDGPAALTGRSFLDFVAAADQERLKSGVASLLTNAGPDTCEITLVSADGRRMEAESHASTVLVEGGTAVETLVRDLTARKEREQESIQTAKLATLGEMAAGMTHELSQPLNVIRFAAEGALMRLDRGRGGEADARDALGRIEEQAGRMGEIMDHMRVFSRRDTGAVETFDAVAALRSAADLVESSWHADAVPLVTHLPEGPLWVRGRPVQLEQVMLNLLNNARDAVLERRGLEDEDADWTPRVTLGAAADDRRVRLWVLDNGLGIPGDMLDRLFEPFYTTKESGRGTGLGLSVSYSIAAGMGGRLRAANESDEGGARLTVELPAAAAPEPSCAPAADAAGRPGNGEHILVVDDEAETARGLATFLADEGYRVTTAFDGAEAWNRFTADPAALVVTDLRMPRGDGTQLMQRLRDRVPDLPIVVVTGHAGATERTGDDGPGALMTKPVSLAELGRTVRRLLRDG